MGSCVSTQHKSSGMKKLQVFSRSNHNLKQPIINGDLAAKRQQSFLDDSNREETFFESQAWLDSDCDDDFMSVNGEFTPSSGNTPAHQNFSTSNNNAHLAIFPNQPSPNGKENKTRLSDFFEDSLRANYDFEDEQDDEVAQNGVNLKAKSPLVHGDKVVATKANVGLKTKRERLQSCFPTFVSSCRSSKNATKMMMSSGVGLSSNLNPKIESKP